MKASPYLVDGTEIVPMTDSQLAEYLQYQEQMAYRSYLFALGPFSEGVADYLEYAASDYDGTDDGTLVGTRVLACTSTSQSTDLAIALGIEISDFNTHMVNMAGVDLAAVKELFDADEILRFMKLAMNKFNFIFMPEP